MHSSLIDIALAIIVGVVGYFLVNSLSPELSSSLAFLIASLVTGFVISLKHVINNGSTHDSSSSDERTTLYVGNLPYRVNENTVKSHFAKYGDVDSVRLMRDRKTGKRKGFGFVEVASNDAQGMIKNLNDTEFEERTLKVRLAKDKTKEY